MLIVNQGVAFIDVEGEINKSISVILKINIIRKRYRGIYRKSVYRERV